MQEFFQQLINGLSYGAIYALIAVGYTMVYGVLRLINFAHGDVYMIGAMAALYAAGGVYGLSSLPWSPGAGLLLNPAIWLGAFALVAGLLRMAGRPQGRWLRSVLTVLAVLTAAAAASEVLTRAVRAAGLPSWPGAVLVLLTAMVNCAALGYVIERVAYRPLRNQARITALITAIGVSMFLEFGGQAVFGASPQAFPQLIPGLEEHPELCRIGGVVIGRVDAMIVAVTLAMMSGLWWIVMRTRTGMALRAVSFRFDTAALMGIDVNRIIAFTFVLGSALAAVAGVLVAVRSPKVDPLMGLMPGIKAFVAAVLGGIGNVPGAVLGGLVLGVTEVMVAGYFPQGSQYRDGVAFVILIGVLLLKPSGLLGQNVVEKV